MSELEMGTAVLNFLKEGNAETVQPDATFWFMWNRLLDQQKEKIYQDIHCTPSLTENEQAAATMNVFIDEGADTPTKMFMAFWRILPTVLPYPMLWPKPGYAQGRTRGCE